MEIKEHRKCCNVWCPNNTQNNNHNVCKSMLKEARCADAVCEYPFGYMTDPDAMLDLMDNGIDNNQEVLKHIDTTIRCIVEIEHPMSDHYEVKSAISEVIEKQFKGGAAKSAVKPITKVSDLIIGVDGFPWHNVSDGFPECETEKSPSQFLIKRENGTIQLAYCSIAGFCSNYSFYEEFMIYDAVAWVELK